MFRIALTHIVARFVWGALAAVVLAGCQSSLSIRHPAVEMQANPQGVDSQAPRFSWTLHSAGYNVTQKSCQIKVAASEKDLRKGGRLLWNTGRVDVDQSILVPYAGEALEADATYYWQITAWDNNGRKADSKIQRWTTSLLKTEEWKARWIGLNDSINLRLDGERTILPARYLRKEFLLPSAVKRATLYISGLGSSVCYLNGERVGHDIFGPIPTWYNSSVSYLTYDVTSMLRKGSNAIGVILGNGRFFSMRALTVSGFGLPRLKAQLHIECADGEAFTIISDESWKATARGPIRSNNEYDGETYDARMDLGQWTAGSYDDSAWEQAVLMEAPKGKLVSQRAPGLKVMEEVRPLSVKAVEGGRCIVDMGQNMSAMQQVRLKGKKGRPITMRFAEVLKENGTALYLDNLRTALVTDVYIPDRDGEFVWQPTFVSHGFRFMEVSGLDYKPEADDFIGKVVYDEMPTIGTFTTSDERLNRLFHNAYWGIRSNYRGMPTDCPQRDERQGWLGDRTTGAYGESFIFGNALLYKKWLMDIEESMNKRGSISDVSPRYAPHYTDNVTWPAAYFYVADMLYRQFGDASSILHHYPSMKRWVNRMTTAHMKDFILVKDRYGDWCVPPERPELISSEDPARKTAGEVLSTTVFYGILQLMQKFANINGLPADSIEYANLSARIKDAYNRKYFHPETGCYDNNTVTANMLSLRLGLVPEGQEERVFAHIVSKTMDDFDGHVSTGVVGIQHLMRGLTEHGALELAYRLATQDTYPSWGYMIKNGATTIWELWNGDTANPAMNSHNHVMLLGDLLIWFYEHLAGIKNDPASVGFKRIWMEPSFPEELTEVNASYRSPYGLIASHWKRDGLALEWNVTIPVNTTATVVIPSTFPVKIVKGRNGMRCVRQENGRQIIELGSGEYKLATE